MKVSNKNKTKGNMQQTAFAREWVTLHRLYYYI